MKNSKKLSREEQKSINGGFTPFQIETCGGAALVCYQKNGAWGCWRSPGGGMCYQPML
ncbi:hypothetical protein M2347_000621 [Chryseobacterium sp. H1D6B]|uniref:bacteriocin-like protein n=1 Tax=Chryseobacterium sp. H1D6B TaxID=2940588 RepID=UPI0015CC01C9|nr:hypothetical protein [Chryseobacterium sp. H1D6B]MDH6250894.1 hypothetical protein [Chryseobacterium sp. H1D6B]